MPSLRQIAIAIALSTIAAACSGSRPVLESSVQPDRDLTETTNDIVDRPLTGTASGVADPSSTTPIHAEQTVVVTQRLDHDTQAFTQGLVFDNGRLFESRGLNGQSALTEIHPETGEVLRRVDLAEEFFAEGLAVVGDRLIQLTFTSGTAFVYDLASFQEIERFTYQGEGWGLCYDGVDLWMSDGSDVLVRRDPDSFEAVEQVDVTLNGQPVIQLNELECVGDLIWANVWLTNTIVIIDPASGEVISSIDASGLLTAAEAGLADVLNGIAYDERRDVMIITGKWWPAMFEVELGP